MTVLVIPAIDVKGGRCVRLKQGVMSEETVFSEHPEEMAVRWFEAGAKRIHVVDLDGAVQGSPINREVIKKIVEAVPVPIQLGGGIRGRSTLETYLDMGIAQVILGTVALKNSGFMHDLCVAFPNKLVLGIDAREGRVAVEGWTEETLLDPVDVARRFEDAGIWGIIYTDISRDGMGTGPNVNATKRLARAVNVPVIASGGIGDLADVRALLSLEQDGVAGMITGRALYDGRLDLQEAIRTTEEK